MIRGYHEYKDLLSDTEVGNPRDTYAELSHVARLLFSDFVWRRKNLAPTQKKKQSGLATWDYTM